MSVNTKLKQVESRTCKTHATAIFY